MTTTTTRAVILAGTKFEFNDLSVGAQWIDLPELVSIGPIGTQGSFVDVTPIDITGRARLYTSGLQDNADNEIVFNLGRPPYTEHQTFRTLAQANARIGGRVTLPNGESATFQANLSGYQAPAGGGGADAALQASVTMKIDGESSWT